MRRLGFAVMVVGVSVVACAKATARLQITVEGNGATDPPAGTHAYPGGSTVKVTAHPAAGAAFAGWRGVASGVSNPVTVVLEGDQTLVARFSGGGTGSSGGSGSSGGTGSSGGGTSSGGGAGTPVSIDAGGDAAGAFLADAYYSGGSTYSTASAVDTSLVTTAVPPPAVFQTERYGEFTYTIPDRAPRTAQAVTLYFAETLFTAAGQRTFDVAVNGATALAAFDIFAAAGGANRAIARTVATTANDAGQVVIEFRRTGADNPKVCGITVTGEASTPGSSGGGASSGGGTTATGPCDLYAAGGTPCVAAHSTVRALYGAYGGRLYQVRRSTDSATRDVATVAAGGAADAAAQDAFCSGATCVITIVYDQSGKGNHLEYQGPGSSVGGADDPAVATTEPLGLGGHRVYSLYIKPGNSYWRNGSRSGIPTGAAPEGVYMVTSGTHVNGGCCFDYGNSETTRKADGPGAMDAIYFGTSCWFGGCSGAGPWVQADLEWGLYPGGSQAWNPSQQAFGHRYVTAMLKNDGTTRFALKGGNAQSGGLTTLWDGALPRGYSPMKKQGAIVLGSGGDCCADGRNQSEGTFYEGAIVSGFPSEETETRIQANIVGAGYGG